MAHYRYTAALQDGRRVSGVAAASNSADLAANLRRQNAYLLRAAPAHQSAPRRRFDLPQFGSSRALLVATGELRVLLAAGTTVDRAVGIVATRADTPALRAALASVCESVRNGKTFADAIATEPRTFSGLYVALVRAGEASAQLPQTMAKLHAYLARRDVIKHRILSALIYPCILLVAACGSLLLLSDVVLPQFLPMFRGSNVTLPLITRIVVCVGAIISGGWPFLLASGIAGIWLAKQCLRQPQPQLRAHAAALKIPVFGPIWRNIEAARLARTAGTLIQAGASLPTSLGLAADVLRNAAMRRGALSALKHLREGTPLSEAMHLAAVFPHLTVQLLAVAEETGRVDTMLMEQADMLDEAAERRIGLLLALLVPALTVSVGLIVGSVLAAIMLAVLRLNELAT